MQVERRRLAGQRAVPAPGQTRVERRRLAGQRVVPALGPAPSKHALAGCQWVLAGWLPGWLGGCVAGWLVAGWLVAGWARPNGESERVAARRTVGSSSQWAPRCRAG